MNCKNKNRRNCLMYDSSFFMCLGLKDTSGSKNCPFFKDKRDMAESEIKEYRTGCRNGFDKKEKILSAWQLNKNGGCKW